MAPDITKQIVKYSLPLIIALGFSACGGGGGGSDASSNNNGKIQIDIDIPCTTNPSANDIDTYVTLQSGDTISKSGDVTIVTYHDSNGNKKVCKDQASTGSAYILRGSVRNSVSI